MRFFAMTAIILSFASNTVFAENKANELLEKQLPQMTREQKLEAVSAIEEILAKKKLELEADSTEKALVDTQIDLAKEYEGYPKQYSKFHAALAGVAGTSALGFLTKSLIAKKKAIKNLARFGALSFTGSTLYLGFESKKVGREEALIRINTLIGEINGLKALLVNEKNLKRELQDNILPGLEETHKPDPTEHAPQE
jgi:hypothetical protein